MCQSVKPSSLFGTLNAMEAIIQLLEACDDVQSTVDSLSLGGGVIARSQKTPSQRSPFCGRGRRQETALRITAGPTVVSPMPSLPRLSHLTTTKQDLFSQCIRAVIS